MSSVVLYEGPGASALADDERLAYLTTCVESGVKARVQATEQFETDDASCALLVILIKLRHIVKLDQCNCLIYMN